MLLGAALWGGIGFLTGGLEIKYAAVAIGILTGTLAARFGGGRTRTLGMLAAATGVFGLALGKGLFELLVQPGLSLSEHIAYHTTPIDFVFFAATAVTGFGVASGLVSPRHLRARARRRLGASVPTVG